MNMSNNNNELITVETYQPKRGEAGFVLRGSGTKTIKDDLKKAGCLFNKNFGGEAGWFFRLNRKDAVFEILQQHIDNVDTNSLLAALNGVPSKENTSKSSSNPKPASKSSSSSSKSSKEENEHEDRPDNDLLIQKPTKSFLTVKKAAKPLLSMRGLDLPNEEKTGLFAPPCEANMTQALLLNTLENYLKPCSGEIRLMFAYKVLELVMTLNRTESRQSLSEAHQIGRSSQEAHDSDSKKRKVKSTNPAPVEEDSSSDEDVEDDE